MSSNQQREPSARSPWAAVTVALAIAVFGWTLGCQDAPTQAATDELTPSFGKGKGGGGGGSGEITATFDFPSGVPVPTDAGLYSDGGLFTDVFDLDQASLTVDCPRTFVLVLPTAWPILPEAVSENHCSGQNGFSRLDFNDLGSRPCASPLGCPIGTTGHTSESGPGFAKDLNYYFTVNVPKRNGKGTTIGASYNVVWIDALFTIDQTDTEGTACRWHLWADNAEFWEAVGGDPVHVIPNQAIRLDVMVERQDLSCP